MSFFKPAPASSLKSRRHALARRPGLESLEERKVLSATPFYVDNLNDSGAGSLRAAIQSADENPGAADIWFQANLAGSISLKSALPVLDNPQGIDIYGPTDANKDIFVTVNLADAYVGDGSSIEVAANDSTTVNGLGFSEAPGRAFENYGSLTLDDVTVSFSHNGAAVNYGSMTVEGSTIEDNVAYNYGGAINNYEGTLTSMDNLYLGNSTTFGGAIDNSAKMTSTGDSFSFNRSDDGGAIYDNTATQSVVNGAKITGNTSGLGGGIYVAGTPMLLQNSNVYGNHATAAGFGGVGSDIYTDSSLAPTSSMNLIGDGSGFTGIVDNNNFDRPYVAGSSFNPQVTYNASKPTNYIGTHASPIAPDMEQSMSLDKTTVTYDYFPRTNTANVTITPGTTGVSLVTEVNDDNSSDNDSHYYANGAATALYLSQDSGELVSNDISLWEGYDVLSLAEPTLTVTGTQPNVVVTDGITGVPYTWE
jgi:hypothetical protein